MNEYSRRKQLSHHWEDFGTSSMASTQKACLLLALAKVMLAAVTNEPTLYNRAIMTFAPVDS
jgi:hypothetical protein